MIAEPIRALLGEDLAGRVEEVLRGAGPEGGDLDLVAGNDGSYLPAGEVERRLHTAALRAGLAGLVHDPDDILPLVDLDAVETDGSGGLRTDLEALLAPIRTAKPYLFRTGEAEPPVLAGAVPAPPGGAPRRSYTMEELGRLTMEEYSRWYTPAYVLGNWIWRCPLPYGSSRNRSDELLKMATDPLYAAIRKLQKLELGSAS